MANPLSTAQTAEATAAFAERPGTMQAMAPGLTAGGLVVPFVRHVPALRETAYAAAAIKSGQMAGPGPFSARCEAVIRAQTGADWAALVPSCSSALELAALLLDLGPGDEVVMPSFTFPTTASAVALRGAVPVFADVDPVTLNLCPDSVATALTPRTRAIFVVHYAGVVADMPRLLGLARQYGLVVVEDAAQAYGATQDGRSAGTFGALGCFSFHGTKNISAGEGGALLVNDPALTERAAILRDKGTDRGRYLRGQVDAYSWLDLGSSQVISEVTAAVLLAQLEQAQDIGAARLALWSRYRMALRPAAQAGWFTLPDPPVGAQHNGHIFFLMLPDTSARDGLKQHLAARGIMAATHYMPLHTAPAGRRFGKAPVPMPHTERAGACLLRLPLWLGMDHAQDRVIEAVLDWCSLR